MIPLQECSHGVNRSCAFLVDEPWDRRGKCLCSDKNCMNLVYEYKSTVHTVCSQTPMRDGRNKNERNSQQLALHVLNVLIGWWKSLEKIYWREVIQCFQRTYRLVEATRKKILDYKFLVEKLTVIRFFFILITFL